MKKDALHDHPSLQISSIEHYNEISIYVFPEKELGGLTLSFHIHVSVSDVFPW